MIMLLVAFAVILAIVLTATTLTALVSTGAAIYLWRRHSKAQERIETLTASVYTLYADKAVLMAQRETVWPGGGKYSTIH